MSQNRKLLWLELLSLLFLTLAMYLRTVHYDFVWDDKLLILDNPYFHQKFNWLSVFKETLWSFARIEEDLPYYRPVVTLLYWVETKIWGFQPEYFHAANVFMHMLSVVLVWKITQNLHLPAFGRRIACLFYALHPAQVSCVAFISCHGDLLVQVFGLLAFLLWMKEGKGKYFAFPLMFLAMLSKEAGVMLPFVLIAYDIFIRNRSFKNAACWFPVLVLPFYFSLRMWANVNGMYESFHLSDLWENRGAFLTFAYFSRIVFPIPNSQNPILPEITNLQSCLIFIALGLVAYLIFRKSRNKPMLQFFWIWFFLETIIIANWANQRVRFSDQLLYVPMVPFSFIVGSITIQNRKVMYAWVVLFLLFFGISYAQVSVWKNDYVFWKNEMIYRKNDPAVVLNYIGEYNRVHPSEDPCKAYKYVLELLQNNYNSKIHYLALYNLGNCYSDRDPPKAEKYFRKALEVSDRQWLTKNSLIYVLTLQSKYKEALEIAQKQVQDRPELFGTWRTLGVVYAKMRRFPEAVQAFREAEKINPTDDELPHMIEDAQNLQVKMKEMQH